MLFRQFKLILIKIGFFMNSPKFTQRPCTIYSTGCLAKFRQKWLGKNSPF